QEALTAGQWDALLFNPLTPDFDLPTVLHTLRQNAYEHMTGNLTAASQVGASQKNGTHAPLSDSLEDTIWAETALPLIVVAPKAEASKTAAHEALPRAALQAIRDGAADYFVRDDLARLAASLHREIARQRRAVRAVGMGDGGSRLGAEVAHAERGQAAVDNA